MRADLIGKSFGHVVVVARDATVNGNVTWRCQCVCGSEVSLLGKDLKRSPRISCGCMRTTGHRPTKTPHGMIKTPVYGVWRNMIQRCVNPKDEAYKNYGGRGIKVCERWMDFLSFFADMGHPPKGMSIERDENDGPYAPGNCRWATKVDQIRNRRTSVWIEFGGRRMLQSEWAVELGLDPATIKYRMANWPIERALQRKET